MNLGAVVGRARNGRAVRARRLSAGAWVVAAVLAAVPVLASPARAGNVSVSVQLKDDTYQALGEFVVPAPDSIAWNVLTDYDHIGGFVSAVRSSSIARDSAGTLKVRQVAVAGMFPFKKTVTVALDVVERPRTVIEFRDTLGRDFRHYEGRWDLTADPSGTRVRYTLDARPRVATPSMLARMLISHDAAELLEQVRAEMLRRSAHAPADKD